MIVDMSDLQLEEIKRIAEIARRSSQNIGGRVALMEFKLIDEDKQIAYAHFVKIIRDLKRDAEKLAQQLEQIEANLEG